MTSARFPHSYLEGVTCHLTSHAQHGALFSRAAPEARWRPRRKQAAPEETACGLSLSRGMSRPKFGLAIHEISLDVSNHTQLNQREDKHP